MKDSHPDPWVYRGAALCASQHEPARPAVEVALAAAEASGMTIFARGHLAYLDQDWSEAERLLRIAVEQEPRLALAWNTLGAVLQEAQRSEEAIGVIDRALKLAPDLSLARNNRLRAEIYSGVFDRLILLLETIPERWLSIREPVIPLPGGHPSQALTTATAEELTRAQQLITTLALSPLEKREDLLGKLLKSSSLTEVDLWYPGLLAQQERLTSRRESAVTAEAWMQLAEAAGRKDAILWAASNAAEDMLVHRNLREVEEVFSAWAAIDAPPRAGASQAQVLLAHANMLSQLGRNEDALTAYRRARHLFKKVDSLLGQGNVLRKEAELLFLLGRIQEALNAFREARALFETVGSSLGEGYAWMGEANILQRRGENTSALAAYRKAETLFEKVGDLIGQGNAWLGEANLLHLAGDHSQALSAYRKARDYYVDVASPMGQGNTWQGEADVLFRLKDNENALDAYRKAKSFHKRSGSQIGQGNAWRGEADVLAFLGENEPALQAFRNARKLSKAGGDQLGQGNAWSGEAGVLARLGDVDGALRAYRNARALLEAVEDSLGQGNTWAGEARVLDLLGQHENALSAYRKARALFEIVGEPLGQGNAWFGEADVLFSTGFNEEALAAYRKARELFETAGSLHKQADTWRAEADILTRRGANEEALNTYRKARELFKLSGSKLGEGNAWLGEGDILLQFGNNEGALGAYRRARSLFEAVGSLLDQGNGWRKEAYVLLRIGRIEEALQAYRKARSFSEMSSDPLGQGNSWEGEARIHFRRKQDEAALEAYRKARTFFEAVEDPIGQGNSWRGEAEVLLEAGDFVGARAAGQKAEAFARASEAGWNAISAILLQAMASGRLGESAQALELSESAIELYDELRGGFLTDPQRTRVEGILNSAFDLSIVALLDLDRPRDALARAEQARSRVLLDLVATRFTAGAADRTLAGSFDLEQQYDRLHDELAQVARRLRGVSDDESRRELLDRRDTLDRRLESLAFERLLSSNRRLETASPLSLEEMQAATAETGPVLYYYVATAEALGALLLPGESPKIRRLGLSWSELTQSAREFAELLANPNYRDRFRERGRELERQLVGPFRDDLPAGGPLLVIPHGPLHQIPFEALVEPQGRMLLERFDVTVAPSLSTLEKLRALHRPRRERDRFLALASGEGLTIPLAEIRAIARFFDPRESADYDPTLTRFATYRQRAPRARHLLIASQGVHRPNSRRGTYLEIEPSDSHDGRLTAAEIAAVPLEAELVTLAACDTARGEPLLSDERLDLTRAFLTAGANAVLATRWKVPEDFRTSRFLVDFYRAYRQGGPDGKGLRKDQALSEARRRSVERGDPPQIWAAWVLVGDPR